MQPVPFKQSNKKLEASTEIAKNYYCKPMDVYTDGEICISRWKIGFLDRIRLLFYGHIWVGILNGGKQNPMWLDACETVFYKEERK